MKSPSQPMGLFGGTFDPVHNGHLHVAKQLHASLPLCEISFIPCYQNVLRDKPQATSAQRLTMLELALENYPAFSINPIEINQKTPRHTIDTLTALKKTHHAPLALIIGSDILPQFNLWHRWQEIINLSHIIIVKRPNHPIPNALWLNDFLDQHLTQDSADLHTPNGKILIANITEQPTASTTIRQQVSLEEQTKNMLPNNVKAYIKAHHLYEKTGH